MASLGSLFAETMVRLLVRPPATAEAGERAVHAAALRPAPFGPPKRLRRDVGLEFACVNGWTIYTVAPTAKAADKAVVYVHGGAFYGEITAFHWRLIARIAAETGSRVLVPIYPLVPRGTAREVVEAVAAITMGEVGRLGSQAVSLCGDSAGGTIALAVALHLKDAGIRLRRTVLIHPAVDLTLTNPTIAVVEREDPMLRTAALRPIFERWRGQLDLCDPRVSPLHGDLVGLGPLTVFSGTKDITNPDTLRLVVKAKAAGVQIVFHEGEGMIHLSPALPTREGREARRLIVEALC